MDEIVRLTIQVVALALLPFAAAVIIAHTAGAVVARFLKVEIDALLYGLTLAAFVGALYLFFPALYLSLQKMFQVSFFQGVPGL